MTLASGLYTGLVSHNRVKPRRHKLAYRIFMLLIDLDELDSLKLKTLGVRTFNLFGFDERRFGDGSDRPLKAQIEAALTEAGIECGGPVRMLAMPQILGRALGIRPGLRSRRWREAVTPSGTRGSRPRRPAGWDRGRR